MLKKKHLAALAAVGQLLLVIPPVYAETIPREDIQQLNNSAEPDVDPGASKGMDKPISVQEKMQIDNSTKEDVRSRAQRGGESLPQSEQKNLE